MRFDRMVWTFALSSFLIALLLGSGAATAAERCGGKINPEEVTLENVGLTSLVCDLEAFGEHSPVTAQKLSADSEKKLDKLIAKKAAKLGCSRALRGPVQERTEIENISTLNGQSIVPVEKRVFESCVGFDR